MKKLSIYGLAITILCVSLVGCGSSDTTGKAPAIFETSINESLTSEKQTSEVSSEIPSGTESVTTSSSDIFESQMTFESKVDDPALLEGSNLSIESVPGDSSKKINMTIIRLTFLEDFVGVAGSNANEIIATGIDAAGNPMEFKITLSDDTSKATVEFTNSTWTYLPNGTVFEFFR